MLYISYISIKIKTKHHFRRCIFFFFSSRIFIWFFYSFHVSTEISQLLPYRVLFKSFFIFITTALKFLYAYSNISLISVSVSIYWFFIWLWMNFPACLPVYQFLKIISYTCGCYVVEFLGFVVFPLRKVEFYFGIWLIYLWISLILSLRWVWSCPYSRVAVNLLLRYNHLGAELNPTGDQ